MRIQIVKTGQILELDTTLSIPNLQPFRVLNTDTNIAVSSKIFRVDGKYNVTEVADLDDLDKALEQAKASQRLRIQNGGHITSTSGTGKFSTDALDISNDARDGMILGAKDLQRQRIENNWRGRD